VIAIINVNVLDFIFASVVVFVVLVYWLSPLRFVVCVQLSGKMPSRAEGGLGARHIRYPSTYTRGKQIRNRSWGILFFDGTGLGMRVGRTSVQFPQQGGCIFNYMSATHDVTQLLVQWANGDKQALDDLTPLVYKELRRLAASHLRKERRRHTLQPTALVHEAYLRFVDQKNPNWQNRSHFFGVASQLMRRILVDHARKRQAYKRAGQRVSLEDAVSFQRERGRELLALDSGLIALEEVDPRKCRVIELRYFGGLSMDEVAQTLGVSAVTVRRDLRMAEAAKSRNG
jgi:RNA polymerase sigma-70 factor, ECF subfamily